MCNAEEGRLVGEVQQVGACGAKLMGGGLGESGRQSS